LQEQKTVEGITYPLFSLLFFKNTLCTFCRGAQRVGFGVFGLGFGVWVLENREGGDIAPLPSQEGTA